MPVQVHDVLLAHGVIPDPHIGKNAAASAWVGEKDWAYVCRFPTPENIHGQVFLRFEGLDTLTDAWLNGAPLGHFENMFREYAVEVKDHLAPAGKSNVLVIVFSSPLRYTRAAELPPGDPAAAPHKSLRKCHSDFSSYLGARPHAVKVGVYRDVVLDLPVQSWIQDVWVRSTLSSNRRAATLHVRVKTGGDQAAIHWLLTDPAGKRRWEKFLHANRLYRRETYERRLEIFARADQFCGTPPVTRAKSRLALALAAQLRVLEKQLVEYRQSIETLFSQHPDHDLFGSLPGAGPKIAPRLLGELGNDPTRFDTHESLQCYGGSAPVTKQSGKNRWVSFRRACNTTLRATLHHWADKSRGKCAWAQAYYQHKRDHGQSHAAALRCLANRWVKILWKMWQTHTLYDEALHTRNQVQHGSWVIQLT